MLQPEYIDCQGQHFRQQQQTSSSISPEILISIRKIETRKKNTQAIKLSFSIFVSQTWEQTCYSEYISIYRLAEDSYGFPVPQPIKHAFVFKMAKKNHFKCETRQQTRA